MCNANFFNLINFEKRSVCLCVAVCLAAALRHFCETMEEVRNTEAAWLKKFGEAAGFQKLFSKPTGLAPPSTTADDAPAPQDNLHAAFEAAARIGEAELGHNEMSEEWLREQADDAEEEQLMHVLGASETPVDIGVPGAASVLLEWPVPEVHDDDLQPGEGSDEGSDEPDMAATQEPQHTEDTERLRPNPYPSQTMRYGSWEFQVRKFHCLCSHPPPLHACCAVRAPTVL